MADFGSIYARAFLKPARGFAALVEHPRRMTFAWWAVALNCAAYQLVYFFLARNGGRPTVFTPWLAVEPERYYTFNQYWIVPSILLAWVTASGITQIVARALGGTGTFEDTQVVVGFGLSVSSWWTGAHDVISTALGFAGVIDQRAYEDAMSTPGRVPHAVIWALMLGYLGWFVLTFTRGVMAVHRLSLPRAMGAGATGFVGYQFVYLIFNR